MTRTLITAKELQKGDRIFQTTEQQLWDPVQSIDVEAAEVIVTVGANGGQIAARAEARFPVDKRMYVER